MDVSDTVDRYVLDLNTALKLTTSNGECCVSAAAAGTSANGPIPERSPD